MYSILSFYETKLTYEELQKLTAKK